MLSVREHWLRCPRKADRPEAAECRDRKQCERLVCDRSYLRNIRLPNYLGDLTRRESLRQSVGKLVELVVVVLLYRTLGKLNENFSRTALRFQI
jgi:hypothetical protein